MEESHSVRSWRFEDSRRFAIQPSPLRRTNSCKRVNGKRRLAVICMSVSRCPETALLTPDRRLPATCQNSFANVCLGHPAWTARQGFAWHKKIMADADARSVRHLSTSGVKIYAPASSDVSTSGSEDSRGIHSSSSSSPALCTGKRC